MNCLAVKCQAISCPSDEMSVDELPKLFSRENLFLNRQFKLKSLTHWSGPKL